MDRVLPVREYCHVENPFGPSDRLETHRGNRASRTLERFRRNDRLLRTTDSEAVGCRRTDDGGVEQTNGRNGSLYYGASPRTPSQAWDVSMFTVTWLPSALKQLAEIWLRSNERSYLSGCVSRTDTRLKYFPEDQ